MKKWLTVLGMITLFVLLAYKAAFPSATVRYRLTLDADVDGKPASGSGVIEVRYAKYPEYATRK